MGAKVVVAVGTAGVGLAGSGSGFVDIDDTFSLSEIGESVSIDFRQMFFGRSTLSEADFLRQVKKWIVDIA